MLLIVEIKQSFQVRVTHETSIVKQSKILLFSINDNMIILYKQREFDGEQVEFEHIFSRKQFNSLKLNNKCNNNNNMGCSIKVFSLTNKAYKY
jgi:hypothetical protein